ncbi:glycosyltransferase [Dyadobacter arcticus]|uniref:Cellulose synthase/poly-beta-1,6-N-acetylglucosamine synthase-like glycosyltransferase n=1 Tax=Dyadobacter arcticus TaxID=1078754 RepID=A0ABX0UKU8_9BACT|nr:glycosyltransferase [Dyadobacter arcticus]NIJ53643.1 cellulose synthase/poly-beta-1,6-N-acetylglucosamine synthase-like glycosyltransferase [Dyadobacter arcticus]
MKIIWFLWWLVQWAIGFYLIFPILLLLINLFVPKKGKRIVLPGKSPEADYALIVATYEQVQQLPDVIASILKLDYSNYLIYIVADNCDTSGLHFSDERVILLKPEKILASNTRSHFFAIKNFKRQHERLAIIDSDNLVDSRFLNELNVLFDQGYEAVQGVRKAKNLDSVYACLDAARDIYYHYYDGHMLFEAGSSATLSGSGMAFTVSLYNEALGGSDITGAGFDKILQNAIVSRKKRIAFTGHAVVYDEKTSESEQLVKQRSRWINTWFKYFKFGFSLIFNGVRNLNWNQFLFGFVLLRPPLFIFLIVSVLLMVLNLWIAPIVSLFWLIGLSLFVAGFIIPLFNASTDRRIINSLTSIPVFMYYQVISLLKAKKANKISVATKHNYRKAP